MGVANNAPRQTALRWLVRARKVRMPGEFFPASFGYPIRFRSHNAVAGHLLDLAEGTSVKLSVIALDYDGTVARGDVLDPAVREAIALARMQGIVVLLVTGRILGELRRVAGDLHFVDGVIAENGAVIHFPDSGRTSTLAPLVPESFIAELRRRGIPFSSGQCLVDADANEAPRLAGGYSNTRTALVLIVNCGRVMTSPPATRGVHHAQRLFALHWGRVRRSRACRRAADTRTAISDRIT